MDKWKQDLLDIGKRRNYYKIERDKISSDMADFIDVRL